LDHGIVPANTWPTHRTLHTISCTPPLVPLCRILAAAIRMMEHRSCDLPLVHSHRECLCVNSVVMRAPMAQATTPARIQIEQHGQIQPPPSRVATTVISPAHFWLGWVASNFRCNILYSRLPPGSHGAHASEPVGDSRSAIPPWLVRQLPQSVSML
jgi:hypothetical protein